MHINSIACRLHVHCFYADLSLSFPMFHQGSASRRKDVIPHCVYYKQRLHQESTIVAKPPKPFETLCKKGHFFTIINGTPFQLI